MTSIDTSFEIARIDSLHLRLGGAYWEDFGREAAVVGAGRFEFREGWQTVYATEVETALTRVTLADGTIGWGEPNVPIGPEVYCLVADGLVADMVRGREFAGPQALRAFLYDAQRGRGYLSGYWLDALAGVDIAVWDALGRRAGAPVASLLGRGLRAEIPVYLSGIRSATLAERVERANRWVDSGGGGAKIFLDGDVDSGLRELDGLKRGAPGMRRWMVDTLWSLEAGEAPRAKAGFGGLDVDFLECPLQPEDLAGHRELIRLPGAPIALGEHFRTSLQVADWFKAPRALDVFQPDVGRTGITGGLRQLEMAASAGIATTPHMGNGGAVFQAATLHFAAVCEPTHLQEWQSGLAGKLGDSVDTAWRYRDGAMRLPDRPGLGIEVDEDALQRLVVKA